MEVYFILLFILSICTLISNQAKNDKATAVFGIITVVFLFCPLAVGYLKNHPNFFSEVNPLIYVIAVLAICLLFALPRVKKSYSQQSEIDNLFQEDLKKKVRLQELEKSLSETKNNCFRFQDEIARLKEENRKISSSVPAQGSIVMPEEKVKELYNEYLDWARENEKYKQALERQSKDMADLLIEKEELKKKVASLSSSVSTPPFSMKDYTALNMQNFKLKMQISNLEEKLKSTNLSPAVAVPPSPSPAASDDYKQQLDFLLKSFPTLSDFMESEYKKKSSSSASHDPIREWMSVDEFNMLSESERNQLALDRYIESRKKSKWQIGRDYELSIGYQYELKGYNVQYTGSWDGVADLGRDLIAIKGTKAYIIQCKYWSVDSVIGEKYIAQLYGTAEAYRRDHSAFEVIPLFVTSTHLTKTAKMFADKLGVRFNENYAFKEFPRIKCNVGRDKIDGSETFIYYLPMDPQYDAVKTNKPKECRVATVYEAESFGFRRAYSGKSPSSVS